ncbi:MAG: hypothetical protein EXR99_01625 [Gemmataceae bacterium]|nr:hypothetical protein [Gemmataceae bacterium]
MKCQRCNKAATLHITEVPQPEKVEEYHLCEDCAQKFLNEPESALSESPATAVGLAVEEGLPAKSCDSCGLSFVEFRNSGRLGCAHDYQAFREELLPFLENIHGDVRHCGKSPSRLGQQKEVQGELIQLRKLLQQAVHREKYEDAVEIRDKIRKMEGA